MGIKVNDSREFEDTQDLVQHLNNKYPQKYTNNIQFCDQHWTEKNIIELQYHDNNYGYRQFFYHQLYWISKRNGTRIRVERPTPAQMRKDPPRETLQEMYERIATHLYTLKSKGRITMKAAG